MAACEVIIVCMDNTWHGSGLKAKSIAAAQSYAIKFYCKSVFDANPENEVVLFNMCSSNMNFAGFGSKDFKKMEHFLEFSRNRGSLAFKDSVQRARVLCFRKCPPSKQKRMAFFVSGYAFLNWFVFSLVIIDYVCGSLIDMSSEDAMRSGRDLKSRGIAVDVINFYLGEKPNWLGYYIYARMELDAFVSAANCNNSHIVHVQPGSSISQVLSESIFNKNHDNKADNGESSCSETISYRK